MRSWIVIRDKCRRIPPAVRNRIKKARASWPLWRKTAPPRFLQSSVTAYGRAAGRLIAVWVGAERFIPRVGLWFSATIVYDLCSGTNFRRWVDEAYKDPDRQISCCARLLLALDVPIYAKRRPSRVAELLPRGLVPGLRPVSGTDGLAEITEPRSPVYEQASVPISALLRTIRYMRGM